MDGKTLEKQGDEEENGFVALANEFLEKCNIKNKISKLTDCKDEFFVSVYKGLVDDDLKGLIANPISTNEHIDNCQCVINALAQEVLNVDLSHISANGIIRGDTVSIRNLLEIFAGLLEYFLECMDENPSDTEGELDDSNLLTSQHEVISGLLREEFGPLHQDMYKMEQRRKGQPFSTSGGLTSSRLALSDSSVFARTSYNSSRGTRDQSSINKLVGSGHEADTSEVSDSTNELIKLGETSSSTHSLSVTRNDKFSLPIGNKQPVHCETWSHSTSIMDGGGSDDLTQYTLTSEEGQRDSFNALHKGLDNLSNSLVSSTSSWNQQISPLDSETDQAKLASLGVRPKVDDIATTGGNGGSEGGGSGRSTPPVLHHHYHHHFHHPAGTDVKHQEDKPACKNVQYYSGMPRSTMVSRTDDNRDVPNSAGISSQELLHVNRSSVSGRSNEIPYATLPNFSISRPGLSSHSKNNKIPGLQLPDSSDARPGLPSTTISSTKVPLPDHSSARSGLPSTSLSRTTAPLPDHSSVRSGLPSTSLSRTTAPLPDHSSARSGLPSTSLSRTTAPLPDHSSVRSGLPSTSLSRTTAPSPDHSSARSGLPSTSLSRTTAPLPDHSAVRPSLPSHSMNASLPTSGEPSHSSLRTDIPSYGIRRDVPHDYSVHRTAVSIHDAPLPTHSSLRSGTRGCIGGVKQDSSMYSVSSELVTSLSSTALTHTTATDPLISAGPGLLGKSLGGLSDSVFTTAAAAATGIRKPYISCYDKPLGSRRGLQHDKPANYTSQDNKNKSLETRDKPTPVRDAEETLHQLTSEPTFPREENQHSKEKDSKRDTDGSDSEDSDIGQHSDSAIDYNRDVGDGSDSESTEDSILRRIHERWKSIEAQPLSTKKSARRAVTFNEDTEVIPITSRMDRLRRLLENEAEEQRQQHTTAMREAYAEQLRDIQERQNNERSELKKRKVQGRLEIGLRTDDKILERSPVSSKKKAKKPAPIKKRGRLETIYRPQSRTPRPMKRPPVKTRKRSASASPDIGRRKKVTDFQEALLPSLFEEFPFLHLSPQTTHAMWQKQARQLSMLSKSASETNKSKVQRSVEEAEKRQERLLKILKKELETNQRMRDEHEREERERAVKVKMNERRQIAARARRYYDEYQLRMRSKMLKRRTREEQIFRNLFQEGLQIQKQRVRELQKYAREKRQALEQRQTNEIESLENYYKDQFAMLADGMSHERNELRIRQQAQEKVMRQMRRELRQKMEKEIREVQESLNRDEDSAYFRQLEADRLRRDFQLAMYKTDL